MFFTGLAVLFNVYKKNSEKKEVFLKKCRFCSNLCRFCEIKREKIGISCINTAIAAKNESLRSMNAKEIGKIVRFHRKQSGLSQKELAKIAGLGKTVIFDVEKGKLSIRFETLLKIMEVLNIKIDFISPLMSLFKEKADEKS